MNILPPDIKPISVSELNQSVDELLREAVPAVWVAGEISKWTAASSGHIYFSLKEDDVARLDCAMWRSFALRLPAGVRFHDGMAVIAFGQVGVYSTSGKYQLYVERLIPAGLGAAEQALRALREKLLKLGYFAPERKRPLPDYPQRIGVVTSGTGAAVRDILAVLATESPLIEVIIVSVRVQGDKAADEIEAAIQRLGSLHCNGSLCLDAIIIGRGGGSAEDLHAFNDETVAKAIFDSPVPIISAVGHEIDYVVADHVADVRAATPTHAAKLVGESWERALQMLDDRRGRLATALTARHRRLQQWLTGLADRRAFRFPLERIRERQQRLDEIDTRMRGNIGRCLDVKRQVANAAGGRLDALSPLNVLSRGYSLTQTGDRAIIRDAKQVAAGEIILTRLQKGRITSQVIGIEKES